MAATASESQGDPRRREPGQCHPSSRRPMCAVCTKPLRLCLCGRLRGPPLDTTVGVTVLQHVMEAQHPLNSTRVARLGLRNLAVAQVSDVNNRARFLLRALDGTPASNLGSEMTEVGAALAWNHDLPKGGKTGMQNGDVSRRRGGERALSSDGQINVRCDFEKIGANASGDLGEEDVQFADSRQVSGGGLNIGDVSNGICGDSDGKDGGVACGSNGDECFRLGKMKSDGHLTDFVRPALSVSQIGNSVVNALSGDTGMTCKVNGDLPHPLVENASEFHMADICSCNDICKESAEVGEGWIVKNMDKCSIAYTEKELLVDIERGVKPKVRWLSRGPLGQAAVSNGFVITKIHMKKSKLTEEVSVFEEFSITIPPQSALLFPCQRAINIDASDSQVQHLIVLDGTWAKAQRMYHENPWLQLLPHVKLESDKISLYSEVRQEPRAGCLSTIESMVVAMRKLGEDAKGLDDLLDVFESMIADQRRCKDENWKQKLKSQS